MAKAIQAASSSVYNFFARGRRNENSSESHISDPDVSNSLLYAQNLAGTKYDRDHDPPGWFNALKTSLAHLAWITKPSLTPDLQVVKGQDVNDLVHAVLKLAADDQLSQEALKQIQQYIETHKDVLNPEANVKVTYTSAHFSTSPSTDGWIKLFVFYGRMPESHEVEVYYETVYMKVNKKAYSEVRAGVIQKLDEDAKKHIPDLSGH
ncbi:uncharacterized protein LOC134176479 [Corticium candelabrum]|uniref:uncharacterized protein LOC134176479 n=1 Tax=Corticium candelabrum TaxID=121492 RepID=UPI002E25A05C|nr:uncharacterized protein LOC134176479 [Corticium candelabrum]